MSEAPGAGLPAVVRTPRLVLALWDRATVAAVRSRDRRPEWHADFPREDDRDGAVFWQEDDPWGPRSIVRGRTVLGSIGFHGPPEPAADGVPEVELGFGLVGEAHGWGFATEAVAGLLEHVDVTGVRVRAAVEPDNKASMRVLVKTGFTGLRGSDGEGQLVMVRPVRVAAEGPG